MSSSRHPGDPDDPLVSPLGEEDPPRPADETGDEEAASSAPPATVQHSATDDGRPDSHNMLPPRERRRSAPERFLVRLIATGGIVGIGVAIAAIMVSSHSQGWLVGVVVSAVSVILAALLWSSRQL